MGDNCAPTVIGRVQWKMPASKFLVLRLLACVALAGARLPAGIYVDNGFDQTEYDRPLTLSERREMELDILELLGLPHRPSTHDPQSQLKKSAPKFLLDVYRNLVDKENNRERRSTDLGLTGEEEKAIEESDFIMTFENMRE